MRRPLIFGVGLLVMATLGAGCASSGGRADRQAILDLSQRFFDAMERRDVELASRSVVPEGTFVNVRPVDGARSIRSFSNAQWLEELADPASEQVREWFTGTPLVLIEGDVAVLWGEYALEVDGEMSHTGIDVFTFVRTDDGWRIAGGAYSVVGQPE